MQKQSKQQYSNIPPIDADKKAPIVLAFLFFILFCPPLLHANTSSKELHNEYIKLKNSFEQSLKRNNDQKVLMVSAMKAVAISWALAAGQRSNPPDAYIYASESIKKFEAKWKKNANWDTRDLLCLEMQQRHFELLVLDLVKNNNELSNEMSKVIKQTNADLLETKHNDYMKRKVILSTSLVGMTEIAIKKIGGKNVKKDLGVIMSTAVDKAKNINNRKNIHYRAKMSLLYAANIQTLTSLTYYMAYISDPELKIKTSMAHKNWVSQLEQNLPLPDTLSLTWVAQAQAALPLSYWAGAHYILH